MKPSNFLSTPMSSVLQKIEPEIIARNIMVILNRTGNEFRPIEWNEYKTERLKDGNFSDGEMKYFDAVKRYCVSGEAAQSFCKSWYNNE